MDSREPPFWHSQTTGRSLNELFYSTPKPPPFPRETLQLTDGQYTTTVYRQYIQYMQYIQSVRTDTGISHTGTYLKLISKNTGEGCSTFSEYVESVPNMRLWYLSSGGCTIAKAGGRRSITEQATSENGDKRKWWRPVFGRCKSSEIVFREREELSQ